MADKAMAERARGSNLKTGVVRHSAVTGRTVRGMHGGNGQQAAQRQPWAAGSTVTDNGQQAAQ